MLLACHCILLAWSKLYTCYILREIVLPCKLLLCQFKPKIITINKTYITFGIVCSSLVKTTAIIETAKEWNKYIYIYIYSYMTWNICNGTGTNVHRLVLVKQAGYSDIVRFGVVILVISEALWPESLINKDIINSMPFI